MKRKLRSLAVDVEQYRPGLEDGTEGGVPYLKSFRVRIPIDENNDYIVTLPSGQRMALTLDQVDQLCLKAKGKP